MPICAIDAATLVYVSEDAAIFRPCGPTQEKSIISPTSKRIQIAEALYGRPKYTKTCQPMQLCMIMLQLAVHQLSVQSC